jgi:predicted RNA-binding protein YlqC (UPF0109 family)
MEIGTEVVMDKGVKGKVVGKEWKFEEGIRFVVINIVDENGKTHTIKIREVA